MTYKDQFVVEVKCKGKILRVVDDVVRLPFGSEYSLYLKNLNSKRASVNISIDGVDILDGKSLVINGNEVSEIHGFLTGTTIKNRFKFINKTKEIQDYRGDKIDDGIIRVEFAYEKPKPVVLYEVHNHYHNNNPFYWNYGNYFTGDSLNAQSSNENLSYGIRSCSDPLSDEGITVKGSECNQQMTYTTMGDLEDSSVITIFLKGVIPQTGTPIIEPLTVDTKLTCSTCGKKSKSSYKFCPNCGTFLS